MPELQALRVLVGIESDTIKEAIDPLMFAGRAKRADRLEKLQKKERYDRAEVAYRVRGPFVGAVRRVAVPQGKGCGVQEAYREWLEQKRLYRNSVNRMKKMRSELYTVRD